jgi:23S rRNA (uracil1939-C5)-methyltransferase
MPDDDAIYEVGGLGLDGDGLVETVQGPRFVPGVLPGERVAFGPDGLARLLPPPSPERRSVPLCPHAGRCGGCAVQHMGDDLYRHWKEALAAKALCRHGLCERTRDMLAMPQRSRRRAVLNVRRDRDRADAAVGFLRARTHVLEPVTDCAVLTPRIVAGLGGLGELGRLLLGPGCEARVTVLDTPQGLDVAFEGARTDLAPAEREAVVAATRRHRLARLAVGGRILVMHEAPTLSISGIAVVPPPGAFVQAVAEAEAAMGASVVAGIGRARHVADLFAGLGTFSLALARKARVLAVDSDRALLAALADAARKAQGLKPVETKVRDLYADPLSPRELASFDAVVFDPPRAGARDQARALARSPVLRVVAVSCNAHTLARDLRALVDGGFRLDSVMPIDQFLFTPHLEAVAVLSRPRRP